MRGYFGVGVEGISKAYNLGAVLRTSHAFGASFAFTMNAHHKAMDIASTDTTRSDQRHPHGGWFLVHELFLPRWCVLVGVELI